MKSRFGAAFVALSMVLVVATVALDAPMSRVAVADAVVGDSCPTPYSEDVTLLSSERCIAGKVFTTRGRLRPECFHDPKVYERGAAYWRSECKGLKTDQVEAIAHTRATMRLSQSPVGQVQPDFQFEFKVGRRLADLLQYNRFQTNSPIDLVEVKVIRYDGTAEINKAVEQLGQYVELVETELPGSTVRRRNMLGYFDSFLVLDEPRSVPCTTSEDTATYKRYDVTPSPTEVGLLLAREVAKVTRECDAQRRPVPDPENEPSYEKPYEHPLPDRSDRPPLVLPRPGSDDDNDGQDDFLEDLRRHVPEFFTDDPLPLIPGMPAGIDVEVSWGQAIAIAAAVGVVLAGVACVATAACAGALATAFLTPGFWSSTAAAAAALATMLLTLFGLSLWGDPHLATLDGLAYDLQAVGEFHLLEIPSLDVDVQGRFVGQGTTVSSLAATAFEINGTWVQIEGNTLTLDGATVGPERALVDLGDGATVIKSSGGWIVTWPGQGDRVAMLQRGRDISLHVPDGLSDVRGLLGNANGDPQDDLKYRNGTALSVPASASTLHGSYANSWRIEDDESLFTYGPGQSTDDFTDLAFPSQILTLADYTTQEVEAAQIVCVDQGVLPGPQFEDCVFDVASTGDSAFAASAALVTDVLIDGTDHAFDGSGSLSEDFEASVGPNFVSTTYSVDAATSRIAGPLFDSPGYRFYAREVPRHDAVVLNLTLYAFGPTQTDSHDQTVDVRVGGVSVANISLDGTPALTGAAGAVTQTATGTTAASGDFVAYDVELTLDHSTDALDVQLVPGGFRGVFGTALGVDDIELQLETPPAQSFDVELPLAVLPSDTTPGLEGAGDIEQAGGQDEYLFDLDEPGILGIERSTCLPTARFRIVDRSTEDVLAHFPSCDNHVHDAELPAGAYRLDVTSPTAGTYDVNLYEVPDPQVMPYALDTVVSNGSPVTGAGNIERFGSIDRYSFTVPTGGRTYQYDELSANAPTMLVKTASGTGVFSTEVDSRLVLPAGDYVLQFGGRVTSRTYSFNFYELPPAQVFPYALDTIVSDGAPAAGAGNLERLGSEDRYTFSIPAGGMTLQFEKLTAVPWMYVFDASTGEPITTLSTTRRFTLPEGDYYARVGPNHPAIVYSFRIYEVPAAQTFPYAFGSVVSNGSPTAGAGNLERLGSEDRYTFNVPAGGRTLQFEKLTAVPWMYVFNATTGAQVAVLKNNSQFSLPQGSYYARVGPDHPPIVYSFRIYEVPGIQVFAYTLDTVVSNGVPSAGAGNLEVLGASDRYLFSVPAGGMTLQYEKLTAVPWMYVFDANTGAQMAVLSATQRFTLPQGDYYARIGPDHPAIVYSFRIYEVPAAQVFPYALDSVVSNGAPAAGAGNLERLGAEDRYTFSIPAGGMTLQYEKLTAVPWTYVIDANTAAQVAVLKNNTQFSLPQGSYYARVGPDHPSIVYSFRIYEVPAAQVFPYVLGTVVSNGSPTAGAGNLERLGSEDRYTFSIPAGGRTLQYTKLTAVPWIYVFNSATGAQVALLKNNTQFSLPQGSYYARVGPDHPAITYSFQLA